MSWTERVRLRRFFARRLLPAARALKARGVELVAPGGYREGPFGPEFEELEPEDCERALRELWEEQGLTELAELAGPLLELAAKLETREEPGDVSPFVYVMF